MKQRRHRRRGGSFDDQLAALHHPDHGVEDLAVWERDNLIDEALDDREVELTAAPHAQAVDDRLAIDRLEMARGDAPLHRRTVRRLDADYARRRVVALDGHRHAGDETASPNRYDHRVDLGPVLNNL